MKLLSVLAVIMMTVMSQIANAQVDNAEWFGKFPHHLKFGNHLGKRTHGMGRCSLTLAPSDKKGIIVDIKKTYFGDLFGNGKAFADIHLLPTDELIGSSEYLSGPTESEGVLAMGYADVSTGIRKSIVLKAVGSSKVSVTIETVKDGEIESEGCTVKIEQ